MTFKPYFERFISENMSTPSNKPKKVEKRNLYVRITEENKGELKALAKESHMTMETYVDAVLQDAIHNRDIFTFVKKNRDDPST